MDKFTDIHKTFLLYCADDWTGPWLLVKKIRQCDLDADDRLIQERTFNVLRDLLELGYIRAGDLVNFKNDTFIPWDMPVDEMIDRIEREWDALGRDPHPGEIVWFTSTQAGDRALAEGQERNTFPEMPDENGR